VEYRDWRELDRVSDVMKALHPVSYRAPAVCPAGAFSGDAERMPLSSIATPGSG
jgi:hypothetical protein